MERDVFMMCVDIKFENGLIGSYLISNKDFKFLVDLYCKSDDIYLEVNKYINLHEDIVFNILLSDISMYRHIVDIKFERRQNFNEM